MFGQICATGNAFVGLIVGRNSILNFPAKIWNRMCRALLCCDDSSHSQGQSGKRLLLASKGHPIRRVAYHGSCIDLTHLSHTLNLILKAPGARRFRTFRLLIKDSWMDYCSSIFNLLKSVSLQEGQLIFKLVQFLFPGERSLLLHWTWFAFSMFHDIYFHAFSNFLSV